MVKIYQNGVKMQHIRGACNMKCNTETALKKQKAPDYSGALFLSILFCPCLPPHA